MRYSTLCACAAVTTAAFSCNSDKSDGGNAEASQWIDELAATLCDLTEQCCSLRDYPVPSDCLNQAKKQLHAGLDLDIVQFDRAAAQECLAAYRGLGPSCPNSFNLPICKRVFTVPGADPGGSCDAACAPSDAGKPICIMTSSTAADGAVTRGQYCQVEITVSPGQACDPSGQLPIERHCDRTQNSACIQGVCTTAKPIGAACTMTNSTQCVPEAWCNGSLCVARLPVGAACSGLEDCVAEAYCDTGITGKCRPISKWKKFCSGEDYD